MKANEKKRVKWTPEPWTITGGRNIFSNRSDDDGGGMVAVLAEPGENSDFKPVERGSRRGKEAFANGERIVQCINACAGIADPQATIDAAKDALRKVAGHEIVQCFACYGSGSIRGSSCEDCGGSGESVLFSVTPSEVHAARKALAMMEGKV